MKPSLLLIVRKQFGYHIDSFYYCRYLHKRFDITYLSFDYGWEPIEMTDVEVIQVSRRGNAIERWVRFIKSARKELAQNYDYVFIKHFIGCSYLLLAGVNSRTSPILDIRTSSIRKNRYFRKMHNFIITAEARRFKKVSVISASLAEKLKIMRAVVIPLGATCLSSIEKKYDDLTLIYIGTFNSRSIEKTVIGLAKYLESPVRRVMKYYIIGTGTKAEIQNIENAVVENNLSDLVEMTGYLPQQKLPEYLDRANIGVSFVPIEERFMFQPPTKTYEYILSGIPVIATRTYENERIITEENGVLICDDVSSFSDGLKLLSKKLTSMKDVKVRETCQKNTWECIVEEQLYPFLVQG